VQRVRLILAVADMHVTGIDHADHDRGVVAAGAVTGCARIRFHLDKIDACRRQRIPEVAEIIIACAKRTFKAGPRGKGATEFETIARGHFLC
jgi:hypothetical protein